AVRRPHSSSGDVRGSWSVLVNHRMRRSCAFLGAGRWPERRISMRGVIRGEVAIRRYDSLAASSNVIIGGGMLRHISKAAREVVLNAPAILQRALSWIDSMAFLAAFSAALKPHPARTNHVEQANVICGHKTAVYIWRRWDSVIPQVDP